jgi:hypothetical protein
MDIAEVHQKLIQEKEDRIAELEADLRLNRTMLAKQACLAREAETENMRLKHELAKAKEQIEIFLGIKDEVKPA